MIISFRKLALVVLAISFFTFVALFGRLPVLRKTPIGLLQRILCIHIPASFRRVDNNVTGGRMNRSLSRLTHYLLYQNNPIVLIIFLTVLSGSAFLFLWSTYFLLSPGHLLPVPILLGAPYVFTYLCTCTTADYISPASIHDRLLEYPYDYILFHPHQICRTCKFVKPARSKHCSLCGVCVARADHHCPWVNNCLGKQNYRWFLALLLSLGIVEYYGAYLAWVILKPTMHFGSAAGWTELEHWEAVWNAVVRGINAGGISVAGVGLLAVTTAPLPLGLLAYHVYLVWAGMTTNENSKWADWRDDVADGVVYSAKRSVIMKRERERKQQRKNARERSAGEEVSHSEDDESEHEISWPVSSDQIVLRTTDGKPPSGQERLWSQVTSLDDVDNIYDLGFWDNFKAVIHGR